MPGWGDLTVCQGKGVGDEAGKIQEALGPERMPAKGEGSKGVKYLGLGDFNNKEWRRSWAGIGFGPLAEASKCHTTGEQNFIKSLINFDKDNISDKVLKKIGAYCAQPDFQPDIIGRVSLAAKSLCMWVRAMEVGGGQSEWEPRGLSWTSWGVAGTEEKEGAWWGPPEAWLSFLTVVWASVPSG